MTKLIAHKIGSCLKDGIDDLRPGRDDWRRGEEDDDFGRCDRIDWSERWGCFDELNELGIGRDDEELIVEATVGAEK